MTQNEIATDPGALLGENFRMYLRLRRTIERCPEDIRQIVDEMSLIVEDEAATENERSRALHTIIDALFPGLPTEW